MPIVRQNLVGLQVGKIEGELRVEWASSGDFSDHLEFAAARDKGLGIADKDRILAERGMEMADLDWRVSSVLSSSPDGRDVPLIRSPANGGHPGSDELTAFTITQFPMEIGGGHVQLFN